jgi:hypothetical protein
MLLGLGFAAIGFGAVSVFGLNYLTFSFLMYLYVFMPIVLYLLRADLSREDIRGIRSKFLYVVDEEERRVKRVMTGDEFRINDSEKI